MSLDLERIAARGRRILDGAFATSGSLVTISRDSNDLDETVDLDALDVIDPTPRTPIATDVAAVIAATGTEAVTAGPERDEHPSAFRIVLRPTVTDLLERDVLTVTASRDARLTGAELLVTGVQDDALGIARIATARRL